MAEKKATAKKATETKAAAAKKTTTVKKAAAPKARQRQPQLRRPQPLRRPLLLRQLQRQFSQLTLRMLVSRQVMFIRHWQQQVRLSPLRRLLRLQRFLRRRLFSVSAGSSRRASSLTMERKLHWLNPLTYYKKGR